MARANEVLVLLGEKGLYARTDWPDPAAPCKVTAHKEPAGQPTGSRADEDEVLAEAEGVDYEAALNALLAKVG